MLSNTLVQGDNDRPTAVDFDAQCPAPAYITGIFSVGRAHVKDRGTSLWTRGREHSAEDRRVFEIPGVACGGKQSADCVGDDVGPSFGLFAQSFRSWQVYEHLWGWR